MNSAIERGQSFLDEIALQPGQIRTKLYVAVTAPLPSPEPLPSLPDVLPFDYAYLPDGLRGFVQDISERMQCPPDFAAVAVFVMMGAIIGPDFDTTKSHAPREAAQRKASGEAAKTGVYLGEEGAQSRFRIGFGALIFISFNRLAASLDGSVTCQTRPLGLDNSAS